MISKIKSIENFLRFFPSIAAMAVLMIAAFVSVSLAENAASKMFATPEDAVKAAIQAMRSNSEKDFIAIFGPDGKDLFNSGDAVSDEQGRQRFLKAYDEKNSLVAQGENMVLEVGSQEWPFPIPLVKQGDLWFFDTLQGKDEILNRRVGRNELDTIEVCLAIVDAQREYALKDRDADGLLAYAEKFRSDSGQKNGLYWPAKDGEPQSPLGPAFAKAKEEGYGRDIKTDEANAYHGYFYRILHAQGKNAAGGAYDYIVDGKMIGGFAVVAYPADYGNSGVMTFIVNHEGIVYQKDLGEQTSKIALDLKEFDPDNSWTKSESVN